MTDRTITKSMLRATAAHHEKTARYLRQYGDETNARKAEAAAKLCRDRIQEVA